MGRVNDTMAQIVNSSVLEARERSLVELETSGHESETCLNPELKDAIKEEQRSSMRLENLLEEALKDEKSLSTSRYAIRTESKPPLSSNSVSSPLKRLSSSPKRTSTGTGTKSIRLDVDQKMHGLKCSLDQELEQNL